LGLLSLCAAMATGCNPPSKQSLSTLYVGAYSVLQTGELQAALQSAEQGFQQTRESDPVWNYKFRVLKAEALAGLGRASESLDTLVVDPPPQLAGGEFSVRRRIIQARALCRLDRFPEAELRLTDAEQLAASGDPDALGEVALTRGTCSLSENDIKKAQLSFVYALTFARQHKQQFLETNSQGSLGRISVREARFDEAIDRFKDALPLARTLNARRTEEITLGNIGDSFFELGDFPNANANTMQAEALASSLGNTDDQRLWLMNLGEQYLAQKNYDGAADAYSRALDLVRRLNNNGDTVAGDCLHDLAQVELARHNLPKAEEYNQRVAAMGGNRKDSPLYISFLLTSAEIDLAKGDNQGAEALLKQIIENKDTDDSFRWRAQTDLADLYVKWGKDEEADRSFRDAIHTVEKARSEISQEEKRISFLDAGPFYDGYLSFLIDHGKETQAMLVAEFGRARTLVEGMGIDAPKSRLGLPQIQRALRPNEVILAYWLSDKQSYLWAVTPSQNKFFRLPPQREIDQAVESYNAQVQDRRRMEDSPGGSLLYNMLVKPAETFLPRNAHVIAIPHRSLYKINFETLIVPGDAPRYWINDVTIENTSSLAFRFAPRRNTGGPRKQLLLMGDPIQVTPEYPKLKNAADEMKNVANHFSPAQALVIADKLATPNAYFTARPENYRFIDFVTHGTASPLSPLDSAIVLSQDKDSSYKLYAHDIIKRPLHADIVTVSACYGAGGRTYSGEGLVGLAWAFMRAGAHHVVAALWEAEEAVTPTLMNDFYTGLKSDKSAADALRAAKLKMLRSDSLKARPYYWASLQLYSGS
jgi:CHAT domain-containing protein/Tfp pilus assembly protein PilF